MKIVKPFVFATLLLGLTGCSDNDRKPDEVANKLVSALDKQCQRVSDMTDKVREHAEHIYKAYACEFTQIGEGFVRNSNIYFMVLNSPKSLQVIQEDFEEDRRYRGSTWQKCETEVRLKPCDIRPVLV